MTVSVIFSTYNSEAWLEKVIIGFSVQTFKDFEIIIADDGSREATKNVIDKLRTEIDNPIIHVWQEDNGFQKSQILNKAILASTSDYLIFTDGDCIPREDFVQAHIDAREEGFFLSGGYYKLSMDISNAITREAIVTQNCFNLHWLKSKGLKWSTKNIKFLTSGLLAKILNLITTTNASWTGHNSSGWKKDLLAVNGFNQDMQYGGQDRELGERLVNKGLKSKQIRYSAICVHLDHKRGYVNEETWKKNLSIRENTRTNKVIKTLIGIDSNL